MDQNLFKKWSVAQIRPNSVSLAIRNLERQGFEPFAPKMNLTIKKKNKFFNKEVFVFPGYVFVGIDSQSPNWGKINSTYGVSKILVFNNRVAEISHNLILALKNRYEGPFKSTSEQNLVQGDSIKFNSGPFVDLIANIEKIDAQNRIWLVFNVMGGKRRLKLPKEKSLEYFKI